MTDFEDVKIFGEQAGLKDDHEEEIDSPFALLIEALDRAEDRELVYNTLSDSGVDLDLVSIKKQLESNHVLVSHLNEAKASMIVDKLKDIEADIRFGLLNELKEQKNQAAPTQDFPTTVEDEAPSPPPVEAESSPAEAESSPDLIGGSQTDEDLSSLEKPIEQKQEGIILTTAPSIENNQVKKYLGIVSAEATMKNTSGYDACVSEVLAKLSQKALKMNASAVIAISFDYKQIVSEKKFLVFATGTAIEI